MRDTHLFPFELVEKGSKIIIYGAGEVGKNFLQQIWISKWCEVVMIVDRDYKNCSYTYKPVCSPEEISTVEDYDYIVIAIESKAIAESIENFLQGQKGIKKEKVVTIIQRYTNQILRQQDGKDEDSRCLTDDIKVAFIPLGGFGDYIISLKLFEELLKLDPGIKMDVCGKKDYIKPIYPGKKLNKIIDLSEEKLQYENYDLVICVEHIIHVEKINERRLSLFAPRLSAKFKQLISEFTRYYVDIPMQQYRDIIFIRRASLKQKNRYTVLGHEGVFDIQDKKVHIEYDESFLDQFYNLGLQSYITLNRGAEDVLKDGRMQTKVWPEEYYEELINRIHNEYPRIQVIQIGGDNSGKIKGADRYIFGENLELIKYVLKKSILHFDCEGGLVHLATQLGTKCAVVFGPTPIDYYGYEENINIVSKNCNNCMGITLDWFVNCYRGLEKQECMHSLTPDIVFSHIKTHIESITA